jgi:ABC-type Na+ efflux pump permease subunit
MLDAASEIIDPLSEMAMQAFLGQVPQLDVRRLEGGLEDAKASLVTDPNRLAVAIVEPNAIDDTEGSYELFVREKLDDRVEDELHKALREAIVDARIRSRGLDPGEIYAITWVQHRRSTTVTEEGERETLGTLNVLMPLVFMGLVMMSVMVSGQYLLTTTIEEKQSRVVEMLLSAVSPIELMTGKILGQFCVGLVILVLYSGAGLVALVAFAMSGVVDTWLVLYLLISYVIAYFVIASLMAAVGAAVNELREAQTLMMPLMVIIMVPWLLWLPISRNPDSTLALVTSFLPPVNTFAMLLRITSSSPPPTWQILLSLAIGVASVFAALWFAGKVFRVGLLMHGKPPNLRTLLRWSRMR